jgi:hypothetical protein
LDPAFINRSNILIELLWLEIDPISNYAKQMRICPGGGVAVLVTDSE